MTLVGCPFPCKRIGVSRHPKEGGVEPRFKKCDVRPDVAVMSLLGRLRTSSLLARFGAISLVLTVAVGAVLASVLSTAIENRARQQAEDAALMAVRLGVQQEFTQADLAEGFAAERLAAVEASIDEAAEEFGTASDGLAACDPIELKIFNRKRTIVYHSENPDLVGKTSESDDLGAALEGDVVSGFAHSADDGASSENGDRRLLEVYVPIQYAGADGP